MPHFQPAIFVPGYRAHEHLEFDLQPGATLTDVHAAFARVLAQPMAAQIVTGFGPQLWRQLAPQAAPEALQNLPQIQGPGGVVPHKQHDMWLWLQETGPDLVLDAAHLAIAALAPTFVLAEDTQGFVYRDGRDLTGFIDGTENPGPAEAVEAAILAQGPGQGGSFALVQRWQHQLHQFRALPEHEQAHVFGRTKADSVELEDKRENAHVSRVVVEENGEELEIWRRSVPWGNARANGLQFVAFSADPQRFVRMLQRMFGAEDGVHDRLLAFSAPQNGAIYFVPSPDDLKAWM